MFTFVNNFQPAFAGERGVDAVRGMRAREFTSGIRRPYLDKYDRPCVVFNNGDTELVKGERVPIRRKFYQFDLQRKGIWHPVWNTTSLRKGDWIAIDTAVVMSRRKRLTAWSDLMAMSRHPAFDGWGHSTLEYEAMSDPGSAVVDMDVTATKPGDSPLFDLRSIPLPITYSGFTYTSRRLAISANSGKPLSTVSAEAAGRRNGENVEQRTIGTVTGITHGTVASGNYAAHTGTSTSYGYTSFTYRVTKTDLNTPNGTNPEAVMTDFLEMIATMRDNSFYGPYMFYTSTSYDRYLDDDYFRSGSTSAVRTLRERLLQIKDVTDIRRLDYLTSGYQVICAQIEAEVVQAVEFLPPTVVQWDSPGGFESNFLAMEGSVSLFKAPYSTSTSGILHATTA